MGMPSGYLLIEILLLGVHECELKFYGTKGARIISHSFMFIV